MTINKEVKERKATHMSDKYTSIRGKDGEYRMRHTNTASKKGILREEKRQKKAF